jgi:hypothetical protein
MRQLLASVGLLLALCLLSGCGGKSKVSGKVVKGGQPFTLSDKGVFVISFVAENDKEGAKPYATETKPDGTFVIVGRDGKGIAAGKYKVSVEAFDPYGGPNSTDKLGGKYTKANAIPVEVGKGDIVLDVGK